jgi:thermostable 8-oxoguanine DNA glycosylase
MEFLGDNVDTFTLEPFKLLLEPLKYNGWKFICNHTDYIVMSRTFYELEQIVIEYKNTHYHLSVPINNSDYSYYKKISHIDDALNFLKSQVDFIVSF